MSSSMVILKSLKQSIIFEAFVLDLRHFLVDFMPLHRKTPVPRSLFNKLVGSRLHAGCFPVNFAGIKISNSKVLRTPFYRTIPATGSK